MLDSAAVRPEREDAMAGYTDKHARSGIMAKLPSIETWPNQYLGYEIQIEAPEFTSVCPKTGLPDFGTLTLTYEPSGSCLELKSFKEYLQSYRSIGIFYENVVNRILRDVVAACDPERAMLEGVFNPRGGMSASIEVSYSRKTGFPPPPDAESVTLPVDTPIGRLDVTLGRNDVRRIEFNGVARRTVVPPVFSELYDRLRTETDEYFAGRRQSFDLPLDPKPEGTPFQRKVWNALVQIPFGEVISYADLASWAGKPKAVRAAASACAVNRIPILIPCHRVVAKKGLGGYGGGLEVKKFLLSLEAGH